MRNLPNVVRVKRERTPGWKMPPGTVYVGRPTIYGNPFTSKDHAEATGLFREWVTASDPAEHRAQHVVLIKNLGKLRGRDLACWCALDQECHADVLIEIANADRG